MKKICTLRGQIGENRPQSPKTEFGAQNQYGRVIYPSIGNFTWSKKEYTFGNKKAKISLHWYLNLCPEISKKKKKTS
jgi:hypothetical protein